MKKIFQLMGFMLLITLSSSAFAGPVSIPFECKASLGLDRSIEIPVSIFMDYDFIKAEIEDKGDLAILNCEEVSLGLTSRDVLKCRGTWQSDGSLAELSLTLFTYSPLVTVKRSESIFVGRVETGICSR